MDGRVGSTSETLLSSWLRGTFASTDLPTSHPQLGSEIVPWVQWEAGHSSVSPLISQCSES